ncbi:MAG: hypothetical protein AB2693_15920 [Candidatus Thiodiazotropha sp.]
MTPAESDPECSRILGEYGLASKLIQSSGGGCKADILGVDRQPATPLPSKEPKEGFFPKASRNPNIQKRLIQAQASAGSDRKNKISINDRHQAKLDIKVKDEKYSDKVSTQDQKHKVHVHDSNFGMHKGLNNPVQNKDSSHTVDKTVSSHNQITSLTGKSDSNRRSLGDSRKHPNLVKSQSPSHIKPTQAEKSSTQSVEKEAITQSKPQPVERESILSTFGKEFASSVSKGATSSSKSASISPDFKKDNVAKLTKASANRPVDSSILKEKEANRNGMVNARGRPTLHIPTEVGTLVQGYKT